MDDCVSNAAELVDKMRDYADTADDIIYGICVNTPNVLRQAADAIEQLMQETKDLLERNHTLAATNFKLLAENAKLKAERDAAVADMAFGKSTCDVCEHYRWQTNECSHAGDCEFKWRGVQKEEEA